VMGVFSLSFGVVGYGFDYLMGEFNNLQLITVPVAIILAGSLLINFIEGMNERFFDGESAGDRIKYHSNKAIIWMLSTTFVVIVWMVSRELAYINPHAFGGSKGLLVLGATSPYGVVVSTLVGLGAAFSTLQWGAYSILQSVEAAPTDRAFEGDLRVVRIAEELSKAAGIPVPAVFVVPEEAPNAFAVGRSPKHASIVVSQGLLETLGSEELKGVIAHEISHIRSYDIRLRTASTALFGSVVLLSHWAGLTTLKGSASGLALSRIGGAKKILLLLFGLLSLLVGPVVAYIMVALTSRYREYLADASAAQLTQDPEALIRALKEIERATGSSTILKSNIAHLCIIDPLNRTATSKEGWFADILAAHPPTSKRILALQSMTSWNKPAPADA